MSTSSALKKILPGLLALLTLTVGVWAQSAKPFVTVDAARYQPAVSPDSIVAGFSYGLTASEAWATGDVDSVTPGIQLPTTLNGVQVLVNNRNAGLLYVGPSQINYVVPSATEVDAPASVVVTDDQGNVLAQGTLNMASSSLSIFTFNQSGSGSPAALFTADGVVYNNVTNGDGTVNTVPPGQYLVLFGTGIRAGVDIQAFIGGVQAQVDYAGSQQWYVGLDQINILVPASLQGQGQLEVYVTDGTNTSNTVLIDVGGNPSVPAGAPVITGFDTPNAMAGQIVTVTGTNMPASVAQASVLVGTSPGEVLSVTPTTISFIVPYGAATGNVSVGNASGLRQSGSPLSIDTSVSGSVLDSNSAPISGVTVSVVGTSLSTVSDSSGRFIIGGVTPGTARLSFDVSGLSTSLGYYSVSVSLVVSPGRDNVLGSNVFIPTGSGSSLVINGTEQMTGSSTEAGSNVVTITNNGLILSVPGTVTFPAGNQDKKLNLVRLPAGASFPAPLPAGVFPSVVALISPMGATFGADSSTWATLSFPNADGLPAGTSLDLYSYRSNTTPSSFVKKGTATVNSGGDLIVASGLIDLASIWFVALPADSNLVTSVTGTVVDSANAPVGGARVFVKGRYAKTDKDGKFEIKGVRAKNGDNLDVNVVFITPAGVVLKAKKTVPAVAPGNTDAGQIQLPAPPALVVVVRPSEVRTNPGVAVDMKVEISKTLSAPLTINLTSDSGTPLTFTPSSLTIPAGSTSAGFTVKGSVIGRGKVGAAVGNSVDDVTPANSLKGSATVLVLPPAPVLDSVNPASGAPGSSFSVTGKWFNPNPKSNLVFFKQGDRTYPVNPDSLKWNGTVTDTSIPVTLIGNVPGMPAGDAEFFIVSPREGVLSDPSNHLKFTVTAPPAPVLTGITPGSGVVGSTFAIVGTGLDPNVKNVGIFFVLNGKSYPVDRDTMKALSTSNVLNGVAIQGVVPRMPAGDVTVYVMLNVNGAPTDKSNSLNFKVIAPSAATLTGVDPNKGLPGATFTISGSGFDTDPGRNFVFFKSGERLIQINPSSVKSDGKTFVSGVVPNVPGGDYQLFVLTNISSTATGTAGVSGSSSLPGTLSNALTFTVLVPPPASLTGITPGQGVAGSTFTLTGTGFDPVVGHDRIFFVQNGKYFPVNLNTVKLDSNGLSGAVPPVAAGDYDVIVFTNADSVPATSTTPAGTASNSVKFTVTPPPVPTLTSITPGSGAPGTNFQITGKLLGKTAAVVFKQGDTIKYVLASALTVTDTSVAGVLPELPPGPCDVFVVAGTDFKTNTLSFTFLAKQ